VGDNVGLREIEAKVPCGDLDGVRARLKGLGARKIAQGLEHNVVFDTPEGALGASDRLLRLRRYDGITLTYKGPREEGGALVKERREIELEVSDFEKAAELLSALGFRRRWVYQKRREKWLLAGAQVALDLLPDLGGFVEVECESAGQIRKTLRMLGLSGEDAEARTYAEIFRDYTAEKGRPFGDLLFEEHAEDE